MVLGNNTWEDETRRTLALIQTELRDAEKIYEEAKTKVDRLTKEAEAMVFVLNIHLQRSGKQGIIKHDLRELLNNQKNHEERLKRIAERNNGILKVSSASDLLYSYQILKSKTRMNAYRVVYSLMAKMVEAGIFQKSGQAEFRLVGSQAELPGASTSM